MDDAAVAAAQLEVARATENFGAEKDRFIAGNCNSFARVWKALSAFLLCHSSVKELHSPSTLIPRGEARRSVIATFCNPHEVFPAGLTHGCLPADQLIRNMIYQ